ncbi:uncharacterized protein Eint_080595 [Encephalitozoon intestinalis ATCC 50506]|uniref:Uncharacterized protein n=1 Tax=Encephalitozoon intestinalis (strain ATCC 50506) TaxID=876142 RepID=W8PKJ4_ENCIT|nr:uncharacterized protein Eint_080595 [Encephalitozoon intestinalis ATCC 50506]AHL30140.1 hypothetical protein Eint_080595 [Encephalitozoon intestinalis ATCC 50506]UTX45782.1 hypothetical protein GPK93_08g13580 [Encephalitozoon intestinalis]
MEKMGCEEERLDMIIRSLREMSADLDHLLLLGSDVKDLSRNLDKFL